MRTTSRPSTRLLLGLLASAAMFLGACSSNSDESSADESATTVATTVAADTSVSETSAAETTSPETTTAPPKDIGNSDIRQAMEVDEPELWALVDYDVMSWDAFSGFTVPVAADTDVATATELCEAISKIVYQGSDNSITIAGGVSMDNLKGTPIVVRASEAETCTAA